MNPQPGVQNRAALESLTQRPLLTAIMQRRTHRVSRGSSIEAGSMSYTSESPREPSSKRRS